MIWKRYRGRDSGNCEVAVNGESELVSYELGIIETGRSRVFSGYFVRVTSPDGDEWIGEDAATILGALRIVDEVAAEDRCVLMCAGLHDNFYESGLSHNSGFGYIKGYHQAYHMMARPRLLALDGWADASSASHVSMRDKP